MPPGRPHGGGTVRRLFLLVLPITGLALMAISRYSVPPATAISPTPTPAATAPTSLPARFTGALTLFGKKASGSVTVTAYVASTACGSAPAKSGIYAVNVTAAPDLPGCGQPGSTVTFKVGDYWANETGTWRMGEPQTLDLSGPKITTVALTQGCGNQVTMTFSNKTPIKSIRAAVDPPANLAAIWKWNAKAGRWDGDFPGAPDSVNTLKTVDRLDTVWICAGSAAALVQPALDFQPNGPTGLRVEGDSFPVRPLPYHVAPLARNRSNQAMVRRHASRATSAL